MNNNNLLNYYFPLYLILLLYNNVFIRLIFLFTKYILLGIYWSDFILIFNIIIYYILSAKFTIIELTLKKINKYLVLLWNNKFRYPNIIKYIFFTWYNIFPIILTLKNVILCEINFFYQKFII